MSKVREKALEQAINQTVALRRKIVDCRFERWQENRMLEKTTDVLADLERTQEELHNPPPSATEKEVSDGGA
jgi:hypothetical protein